MSELLVVAGEASGDRAAAAVVAQLDGVRAFGMGGGALAREGVELVADLRETTAMGFTEVGRRAAKVARAWTRVKTAAKARRPSAALLVNYTEFNTRLASALSAQGTRVLWYGAPQTWAWRPARGVALRAHVERMAVMLPFEERLWRDLGVDAHYVGHPALEDARAAARLGGRDQARARLGLTREAPSVAILAGSRPHEVRRLLPIMLSAFEAGRRERAGIEARVLVARSLDEGTRTWALATAREQNVPSHEVDARDGMATLLPAFDASLVASGTATLECALARVVPVIAYRVGLVTELGARMLLDLPHVGLPNILLGEGAFPELLQRRCAPGPMAHALLRALDERAGYVARCADVEATLVGHAAASSEVARLLAPLLARRPSPSRVTALAP